MRRHGLNVALLRHLAADRDLTLRDASEILDLPVHTIVNALVDKRIAWAGGSGFYFGNSSRMVSASTTSSAAARADTSREWRRRRA